MTSRSPSLPQLSDRGRGLAEIKGTDPMDRRLEVEKKERYGKELREQMAANAERSRKRREGPEQPDPPDTPYPPSSATGVGGASGSGSRGRMPESHYLQHELEPTTIYDGSPSPPMGSGHPFRHASSPSRTDIEWGTADKVSQIQDIMRQRLKGVEDEQHRMWSKIQAYLAEQGTAAARAADEALRRQLDAARAAHDEELRRAMDLVAAAKRECAEQAHRSEAFSGDLHSLRMAVEQLQIDSAHHKNELDVHTIEIERLKHAHEECARFRADMQRLQHEMQDAVAKMREEAKYSREHLERHAHEIDRLRAGRQEDARAVADLAHQQRAMNEAVGQVRVDVQDLAGKIAGIPGQLKKLRDEMPRIAARAARDALEGMRPPEPVQPTLQPSPCPPEVSEEAYAVLRDGNGNFHELPDLRNVVGRGPNCNVCISGSQQISNKHLSVDFNHEGRVFIKDIGSRNGSFLNDHRVPADAGLVLQSGDAVRLGADGPTFVFEYGPAYYARWPREPERIQDRFYTGKGNRGRH